jgi:hypothetical protein
MYCASSGHECKITMARKQRPFYYASEEQFRWLQIIASRINPRVNPNDVAQLKELAESLATNQGAAIKQEVTSVTAAVSPERDEMGGTGEMTGHGEPDEGMEGVVDGIGTLMLDPLGRESTVSPVSHFFASFLRGHLTWSFWAEYIGESSSVAFHRKVREYVQSQRPEVRLGARFPEPHNPTSPVDLVNPDEPTDHTSPSQHHSHLTPPTAGTSSPRSILSSSTLRSRLPPRHLADPLIDRFFKQVHSIFWVFPPNVFLRRLERTYAAYEADLYGEEGAFDDENEDDGGDLGERREIERASWMCCVFTVLALGCSTSDDNELVRPSEFFAAAKGLARVVLEDESIQSIQALLLMVPFHHSFAPPPICLPVIWVLTWI